MMDEQIQNGFALLRISKNDYPEYSDPNSFAANFKPCILYEEYDISTSSSSETIENIAPLGQ